MELPASTASVVAILAGLLAAGMLALRRGATRQTTLGAAWWWAALAVVVWPASEAAIAWAGPQAATWAAPLRLAAVALSFCPVLAVLGAKRPQHAAWSFVVAALWGIVALPAAETYFLQRGQRLEMGDARSWFLWILILLGPINYGPTRQWPAALLLTAGQVSALAEYLPLIHRALPLGHVSGLALACLAVAAVRLTSSAKGNRYDRLWLDFRDTFGLFWALRLQERVNAVAAPQQWPLWLAWRGFRDHMTGEQIDQIEPSIEPALRTTMRGLLRRFVSGRWIAQRLA